jgi:hypothetical protein
MNLRKLAALQIKKHPRLVKKIKKLAREVSPDTVVVLDYPVHSRQRWDYNNPHQKLYDSINKNREHYKSVLRTFLPLAKYLTAIPERQTGSRISNEPYWINGMMPALDGVALYGFIATYKPKIFMEVGSGNSTKFARKAIADHALDTKIVSIDPCPCADVNEICDEIIRRPVEDVDVHMFDRLNKNDVLYIDNSHRVFMNSDATAVFLDIMPRLRQGVMVEIHDVTLPYDYPAEWVNRYYSEQYLLAAYILARGNIFEIILPNMFISHDDELKNILAPLWETERLKNVETHGCSFWARMQ